LHSPLDCACAVPPTHKAACVDGPSGARAFASNGADGRVRSCVRPFGAARLAAGLDGIRSRRP
jgi:hypothetical protein